MNKEYNSLSEYRDYLIDLENNWSDTIRDEAYCNADESIKLFINTKKDHNKLLKVNYAIIDYLDNSIYSELDDSYLFYLENIEKQLYFKPTESKKLKYLEGKFAELKRWLLEKERQIFEPQEYFEKLFDAEFYFTLFSSMFIKLGKQNNFRIKTLFDMDSNIEQQSLINQEFYGYYIFHRMIIYFEIVKLKIQDLENNYSKKKRDEINPFPNVFQDQYSYGVCQYILNSSSNEINKGIPSAMNRLFEIMKDEGYIHKHTYKKEFINYLKEDNNIIVDRLNYSSKPDKNHKKIFKGLEINYQKLQD